VALLGTQKKEAEGRRRAERNDFINGQPTVGKEGKA